MPAKSTIFSLDGKLMEYPGSMLEFHTSVEPDQWNHLVLEALQHLAFLNALKEIFPLLPDEPWTEKDEYFRVELEKSVARMRNIDPLLVVAAEGKLPHGSLKALQNSYFERMKAGAKDVNQVVDQVMEQIRSEIASDEVPTTQVTDL